MPGRFAPAAYGSASCSRGSPGSNGPPRSTPLPGRPCGCLIVCTGDQARQVAYAAMDQAGLLPARLQGPAEVGSYRFADWVKDHPLFGPFADPQYGDLRTLRFRRITRWLAEPDSRVLA